MAHPAAIDQIRRRATGLEAKRKTTREGLEHLLEAVVRDRHAPAQWPCGQYIRTCSGHQSPLRLVLGAAGAFPVDDGAEAAFKKGLDAVDPEARAKRLADIEVQFFHMESPFLTAERSAFPTVSIRATPGRCSMTGWMMLGN